MSGATTLATLATLADWSAERYGGAEAVADGAERWSFRELRDRVDEVARAVMATGLRPGDRVSVWAPNSARWMAAALGALAAGAALVPVNTRYTGPEAADILERAGVRLLFTEHDFLGTDYRERLRAAGRRLPALERTVALHGADWAEFLAGGAGVTAAERRARSESVAPDAVADILFTSGTTGRPKGVLTTHQQTVRVYRQWSEGVTLQYGDRYLLVNPFFHTFGYKAGIIACLLVGAAVVPMPVFDPAAALELMERERISVLTGAPTVFLTLLDHPDRERRDLSAMRMAGSGAAYVPTDLIHRIRSGLGAQAVFSAYGLTESDGTATVCPPHESAETVAGTSGPALPGTELRIDAPAGEPGEVLTRGYHVMLGYLDDPAATAEAVDADGWLHTGDVGVLDERGYLTVTDRIKDMFTVGGFNAYPAEIEQALRGHPAVAEVSVVGAPDERLGEVGAAFVVARAGGAGAAAGTDRLADELSAFARERLANFKVPRSFRIVRELPHNAAGKVDKNALRALCATPAPAR
jgi:acyl-CoA synthetase (AMP-forming)/AMP-acid ligase II